MQQHIEDWVEKYLKTQSMVLKEKDGSSKAGDGMTIFNPMHLWHKFSPSIPFGSFNPFTGVAAGHVGITSGTLHGNADDNSCQLHWGLLLKHILRQH